MKRPIPRRLGLGLLAAFGGGTLAALVADLLGLSPLIAGGTAGAALALIVIALDIRHPL